MLLSKLEAIHVVFSVETVPRKPLAPSLSVLPTTEPKQRITSCLLLSALKRKVQKAVHGRITFAHPLITYPISFALK